ncbi:flagellar biosynthetic protein FliR [Endozoicomonas sp. GU-1]|uniref:flagellar biosynthetic protein FliR n=1 Tax=Endozoicomonas sp. GU-1 TaxID=3009078 RepID=UPI0022B473CD|nr:flagellar biosynthetic protein FliR [Endozoicomonas sp. GU-1]WBA82513.1 flagellar biosynthetic protein FliR [Endozoicomonas sp. GU-1]WBA85444.1 flagellar biosynthetic protein FliR [Endozoicomonas sp. GU-1]
MALSELSHQIVLYLLVFCRISGFVMTCPLTREWLPLSARLLLALALSVAVMLQLSSAMTTDLSLSLVLAACSEFFTGLLFGAVLLIYFSVFTLAGHLTGLQMALGFAELNDPANGISVTVIARIYQVMAQLLFVLINGHLLFFMVVINSFHALPIGHFLMIIDRVPALITMAGWMFGAGLLIALPAIVCLLIVNLTFGFMTRSAPQMNLLTLGFPMIVLVGIVLLSLNILQVPYAVEQHIHSALKTLGFLLSG